MENSVFKSGFIALIGRPNSGKSTLLNAVLGEQLAIVSPMPQTTQRKMRGIYNEDNMQLIFVDTPGIHRGKHQINHEMYNLSTSVFKDSGLDLLCYIVDLTRDFGEEEDEIAKMVAKLSIPVVVVLNKVDQLTIEEATKKEHEFNSRYKELSSLPQIMISSIASDAGEIFIERLRPYVNEGPQYYNKEDLTDASLRFFASEYIRKQIIDLTHEEVPHAAFVEIVNYTELENLHEIEAEIHVETSGQKAIIIGAKGKTISAIRRGAEQKMRLLSKKKTNINLFVKITKHWRDKRHLLKEFGFGEER
jgi:GTP-binding protein Era